MATINFFTRTNTKADKLVPVYCRFVSSRKAILRTKTGMFVKPDHFNNKSGSVRQKADFKDKDKFADRLNDLKGFIFKRYSEINIIPDKEWLIKTIDAFHNPDKYKEKPVTLFSFMQGFIDKAPKRNSSKTGSPVCYKQVREYERTFHYLKEYAASKSKEIDFKDITLDFYEDFIEYLQGLNLAKNTIGKKVQTLKIFLNAATDKGENLNKEYKSRRFKAISEESESIYLNEKELQSIAALDLSGSYLDKVRDLFIIGCWTGLRFSDWGKITLANIDNGFLELQQAKTGGKVIIPIHPTVTAIMDKYNGQLPAVISNQKFNDYLKEVAKLAGLNEKVHKSITKGGINTSKAYFKHQLVTTHTGRRSFATNLYNAEFPTLSIMQVTGHKTEAAFLKYIKVTPREHAQKLKEFWANRPQMQVV
jgi:integrase